MELYLLRTFITVAEEAHLTRAAKRLNISQPSVSAHIKALEEELGILLFDRSKKGMTLTGKGDLMLQKAKRVLDSSNDLLTQADKIKGEPIGAVKIGININPDILRITSLFEMVRVTYPRLEFKLIQSSSHRVEECVKSGEMDCGYILGGPLISGIKVRYLRSIDYMLAGPVSWKEKLENSDESEITKLPWVVHTKECRMDLILKKHFGMTSKNFVKAVEAEDETMSRMIMAGAGLGLLYKHEAKLAEKNKQISIWRNKTFSMDLFFAFCESKKDDPKIEAMLRAHDVVWST